MNINRILAVIVRYLYNFKHSLNRLTDAFYWPAMDLIIWGLTSQYFQQAGQASNLVLIFLTAMVFWMIVWRSQYEITVNLLEELWDRNLVNLFSSPLSIDEWTVAVLLLGFVKILLTIIFTFILTRILYSINLITIGFLLLPFFTLLMFSGWWAGFIVAGINLRFGKKIETIAWSGIYVLVPFSAVYYPVASLPLWAQKIALLVPMSYIFEGMRQVLLTGQIPWQKFLTSFILSIFYLILAIAFFKASFSKACEQGLAKLDEG